MQRGEISHLGAHCTNIEAQFRYLIPELLRVVERAEGGFGYGEEALEVLELSGISLSFANERQVKTGLVIPIQWPA